ncbi:hypothetical protein Efla_003141 [Eimeria flavescens]
MVTSLLFTELQQRGSAALQELQKFISCSDPAASSNPSDSPLLRAPTNPAKTAEVHEVTGVGGGRISSQGVCASGRIKPLSYRLTCPPPPHSILASKEHPHRRSGGSDPADCKPPRDESAQGLSTGRFAINSTAIASSTYPHLVAQLHALWREAYSRSWLLLPHRQTGAPAAAVVWAEVWWLEPRASLSLQLREWGNAAVSRGHYAAAGALYTAAALLHPSSKGGGGSQLAILQANKSLALLKSGKVAAALRAATEAVAADPTYRKGWHRRATALTRLQDLLQKQLTHSSVSSRGTSLTELIQNCMQRIVGELQEARAFARSDAAPAEAAAAAACIAVGACGCLANAPSYGQKTATSSAAALQLWLRDDVRLAASEKGWGLACEGTARARREDDPCLVLEEEAFAVYVHPKQCADYPKLPFSFCSRSQSSKHQGGGDALQLHADPAVRLAWEERVEGCEKNCRGASGASGLTTGAPSFLQEPSLLATGVCAGCAAVPGREEAAAAQDASPASAEACCALLQQWLRPTLPTVPCGGCAAYFCCNACRASSSHQRVCLGEQRGWEASRVKDAVGESQQGEGNRECVLSETAAEEETLQLDSLVRPLALVLQDPQRHIARQLLSSVLPPPCESAPPAGHEIHQHPGSFELNRHAGYDEDSLFLEPPWKQLLRKASAAVVDRVRLTDWLLNAACIAWEAFANRRGRLCGGRCLICCPVNNQGLSERKHLAPSGAKVEAAKGCSAATTQETTADNAMRQTCDKCCMCCKAWCKRCSPSSPLSEETKEIKVLPDFLPRCLYTAALHAYGVASCNSCTIRVSCDSEEDAVAVGTAFYLTASLLNHSCAPNALVVFGEPTSRVSRQQSSQDTMLPRSGSQGGFLLPFPTQIGRGARIQVRLCRGDDAGEERREKTEICISYGPLVGLENSSWGHRQDWLLRHAGFCCRCEACSPPTTAASSPCVIAFSHELLCGVPCPVCTSLPQFRRLLKVLQEGDASRLEEDALRGVALQVARTFLHLPDKAISPTQQEKHPHPQLQAVGPSIYASLPAETRQLVASFSQLASLEQFNRQPQRTWTTTQTLALLGHSGMALWAPAGCIPCESSAAIPSFLETGKRLFEYTEYRCLHCSFLFPAAAIQNAASALEAQLDRMRSVISEQLTPSRPLSEQQRRALLSGSLEKLMQMIPSTVVVGGLLSTSVWRALQMAARTAHAAARLQEDAEASAKAAHAAASLLTAGVQLLMQTLSLGATQPEVCAHIYKAALLYGRAGDVPQATRLLNVALKATLASGGPHSVTHCSVKDYLQWIQQGNT